MTGQLERAEKIRTKLLNRCKELVADKIKRVKNAKRKD